MSERRVQDAARKFKRSMEELGLGVSVKAGDGPWIKVVDAPNPRGGLMATTEEVVRSEQETYEQEDEQETTEAPASEGALFDRTSYDGPLALKPIDGQTIDRIALKFAGTVLLDRSDEADVALWKKLALGKRVDLRVEGLVAAFQGKGATDREGDLDVIVGTKGVKVETVYLPAGEEL